MVKNEKEWWKSKTLWINALAIIGGIATAISADLATGSTITIAGIVNLVLRLVSKHNLIQ